jgi:ferredoxin
MVIREIIDIDEDKCDGCGLCVPACPEGALQIIDGKARLISDLFCDGLGACMGECPRGAIEIEKREAEPYDERRAMENIIPKGKNTIKAHLKHLLDHDEDDLYNQAVEVLSEQGIDNPIKKEMTDKMNRPDSHGGCPGAKMMDFSSEKQEPEKNPGSDSAPSRLGHWPVQLHLVPPTAPYFQQADVVLSADCVAYSVSDFHNSFLKDKALAIACPKLDSQQDIYFEKLKSMIDDAKINTLTVLTMEVPCCSGLLAMAKKAASEAERNIPVKSIQVSIQGEILSENWINTA